MTLSRRDRATTALILGFFASAWFGWGQAAPPQALVPWLETGMWLAAVVGVHFFPLAPVRRNPLLIP